MDVETQKSRNNLRGEAVSSWEARLKRQRHGITSPVQYQVLRERDVELVRVALPMYANLHSEADVDAVDAFSYGDMCWSSPDLVTAHPDRKRWRS